MDIRTVFFIGKPGCGKGTQAQLLSKKTGWPVVGTSGGMREIVASGGAAGHKLKETMDAGILAPSWVSSYVYLKTLFNIPEDGSVIFDGTSRTLPETEIVLESLVWLGKPFTFFHLKVSDDEVRRRIDLRREQESRKDDHVMDKRLEEYYANTEPAIELLRKAGVLTEIDGERAREPIAEDIRKALSL